ncbi:hypothetical protein IQ249_24670 [Lusitaniella coriacea LEGE 07157]|uniref:Uncharacterized protein n=1 Tax=Lusitaniella coriacea LEGE 07157 TaxID=945747 RepID=A0A8J7E695_9CYAN|nr:hypothetical protein [Lusitaniella coriacea]MBE9119054.1 hypothetical protein [Lusitaniella coriacea LEGE 07157]
MTQTATPYRSTYRHNAKRTLVHYFRLALSSPLGGNNIAELEDVVDAIVDAAVEEMKAEMEASLADRAKGIEDLMHQSLHAAVQETIAGVKASIERKEAV